MFSKPDTILLFEFPKEKIQNIHMMFVFFPIDIIFLNDKKEIIEIKKEVKPFQFCTTEKKSKYFIEVPSFILRKIKVTIGEKVTW